MVRAYVFDAYGTLFDVHSVMARCEACFPARGTELSRLWRQKQLEYSWLRSLMGRYEDFERVTADALRHACAALGLSLTPEALASLMDAYSNLAVYPDVPGTLAALGSTKCAILSNGSPRMLEAVVRNAGLAEAVDAVLSVDALRIYKPHPDVYRMATDSLRVAPGDVAFISSNCWDIAGATAFGFRTYWINRSGIAPDELGFSPAKVLSGLGGLLH